MRRFGTMHLTTLVLTLVLTLGLVACDAREAQDDPRGALRDAIMALRDYDGIEAVLSAQLDDAARASARTEGGLTEDDLAVWTSATLRLRAVAGEGDRPGSTELTLVVSDEHLVTLRMLGDHETYARLDLPAVERVATSVGAGDQLAQGISEFEQLAGLAGMGEVASAAREAAWIRVAGLQDLADIGVLQDSSPEPPEDLERDQLAGEIGARLLDVLDDPELDVVHLGDEAAGERVRVTAGGTQLRDLSLDLLDALDEIGAATDTVGMGAGALRRQLEQSIPDELQVAVDVWIDDGELSQVAVDVFELARTAGQPDVPDGALLLAIGLDELTDTIETPDADVTLDMMELFGAAMGGLGALEDLGETGVTPEDPDTVPPGEQAPGEVPPGEDPDVCLPADQAEQLIEGSGQDPTDLDEDEMEALLGLPIC